MKCLSCSSSKSCNKLFLPKTKSPSVTNSFQKLHLDDVELNSKKLKNKFYYKNPEFLNESNINKQINILLTNVTNKRSNNKLPKISLDDDNKSCVIKNHYLKTNNNIKQNMSRERPKYLELDIPTIIPMFNNDEKVDELNRLLEILAKRKKYSITVSMLVVFQQHNYQKLLKDFLEDGVRDLIIKFPLRVVSYHGVPFTINNFFRGMRVEYSKHKLFQKEMIEGNEYVYVNLVYTCIFLSDEIAKICKGSKNLKLKTVHRSLIDEIDTNIGGANNNENTDDGNTNSKFINEMKNLDENGEIKKLENENYGSRMTRRQKNGMVNGIISLDDSEEEKEEEGGKNNNEDKINKNQNEEKEKSNTASLNFNTQFTGNEITKKNPDEKIVKGSIKYQDDLNYMKSTIQEHLNIFDYSYSSPLNSYLLNNLDNITQLNNTFISMQDIGQNGLKCIDNLIKLIPACFHEEINSANENIHLTSDEKYQNKINHLDKLYSEYERTKNLIMYYYSIIQSTVKNIRHSGTNFNKNVMIKDLEYIKINEKKYEKKVEEIFPLINKIYNYFIKEFPLKFIVENLQNESNELNKNDMNTRTFNNFIQGISGLFPSEEGHEHNCFDLIVNKSITYEEKEKQFKNKLIKKKIC